MKNFAHATHRKSLFSLLIVVIGLFSISSTTITNEDTREGNYQIINAKAFIAGSGKLKHMKTVINTFDFSGQFVGRVGELGSVSNFSFSLPVNQLAADKEGVGSTIEKAISNKGCKEIMFVQKRLMILPIMKMIYMSGDVTMSDGSHSSPISLQYETDEDQNIKVKGTQRIRLSEFGIKSPNITSGASEDEIVINIEFTLVNQQFAHAGVSN